MYLLKSFKILVNKKVMFLAATLKGQTEDLFVVCFGKMGAINHSNKVSNK